MNSASEFPHQVIARCGEFLMGDYLEHANGLPSASRPSVLYHFTEAETARKIASGKALWASLSSGLNDASEVRYGVDLANSAILEALNVSPEDLYLTWLMRLHANPNRLPPGLRFRSLAFVTSFCAREDRSGQWLHYGRSGKGCALGFRRESLERLMVPAAWGGTETVPELVRVDYSPESQRRRIARLIDVGRRLLRPIAQVSTEDHNREAAEAAHIVRTFLPFLCARFKHPAFDGEHEWRILRHYSLVEPDFSRPIQDVRLRPDGQPFWAFDFRSDAAALSEVVLGYSCPTGIDAMQVFFAGESLSVSIRRSEVPIR